MLAETLRELEVGDAVAPISRDARELSALVAIADLADKARDLGLARDVAIWRARNHAVPVERVAEAAGCRDRPSTGGARDRRHRRDAKRRGLRLRDPRQCQLRALRRMSRGTQRNRSIHRGVVRRDVGPLARQSRLQADRGLSRIANTPEPSKLAGSTKNIKTLRELTGLADLYDDELSDEVLGPDEEASVRLAISEISDALPSISERPTAANGQESRTCIKARQTPRQQRQRPGQALPALRTGAEFCSQRSPNSPQGHPICA